MHAPSLPDAPAPLEAVSAGTLREAGHVSVPDAHCEATPPSPPSLPAEPKPDPKPIGHPTPPSPQSEGKENPLCVDNPPPAPPTLPPAPLPPPPIESPKPRPLPRRKRRQPRWDSDPVKRQEYREGKKGEESASSSSCSSSESSEGGTPPVYNAKKVKRKYRVCVLVCTVLLLLIPSGLAGYCIINATQLPSGVHAGVCDAAEGLAFSTSDGQDVGCIISGGDAVLVYPGLVVEVNASFAIGRVTAVVWGELECANLEGGVLRAVRGEVCGRGLLAGVWPLVAERSLLLLETPQREEVVRENFVEASGQFAQRYGNKQRPCWMIPQGNASCSTSVVLVDPSERDTTRFVLGITAAGMVLVVLICLALKGVAWCSRIAWMVQRGVRKIYKRMLSSRGKTKISRRIDFGVVSPEEGSKKAKKSTTNNTIAVPIPTGKGGVVVMDAAPRQHLYSSEDVDVASARSGVSSSTRTASSRGSEVSSETARLAGTASNTTKAGSVSSLHKWQARRSTVSTRSGGGRGSRAAGSDTTHERSSTASISTASIGAFSSAKTVSDEGGGGGGAVLAPIAGGTPQVAQLPSSHPLASRMSKLAKLESTMAKQEAAAKEEFRRKAKERSMRAVGVGKKAVPIPEG